MDASKLPADKHDLCRKFASGRITVMHGHWPGPGGFEDRYYPRVAGRNVRPRGMAKDGYLTRDQAIAGGIAFREECRECAAQLPPQATASAPTVPLGAKGD